MFSHASRRDDPPHPPPKDDGYKPLDEIEVARDFRTSLILTQFNQDSDLPLPQSNESDRLSTLPMPSMPWMTPPGDATRSIKPQPTTPPLSPTSSTSDTLVRQSSSTRSSNEPQWRPMLKNGLKNKGDHDFQDIATGPPIIPRSKTPPPVIPLVQISALDKEKNKTIFDSDDEGSDSDLFFNDFSANRPKSKRISKPRKLPPSSDTKRISKFDLASFANHLHENRLSIMQLRQTVHLTEEDERELMNLLEKRKSIANADAPVVVEPPLPERTVIKKPSLLLQKYNRTHAAPSTETINEDIAPMPSSSTSRLQEQERKRRVRKSMSMDEIHRMAVAQDEKTQVSEIPTVETITEELTEPKTLSPSVSTPSLTPWTLRKSASSRKLSSHGKKETGEKPAPQTRSSSTGQKAIGLFGSLRQASRTHQPFRGLVRNLSSAGSYYRSRHSTASTASTENGGMSRAAMAVMEHQKKDTSDTKQPTAPNTKSTLSTMTTMTHEEPDSGGNLITHLLAKASKSRRTKTVNMKSEEAKSSRREKTKSRVVRRTIIYVPPDSINFMKTLKQNDSAGLRNNNKAQHAPPLPADMLEKMRQLQKSTAPTKTPRRSEDSHSSRTEEPSVHEDDDLGSVLNYYDDDSLYDYYQSRESGVPQLEGLEVREMSDGTVEWGIVKKQGNRKSFYVQDNNKRDVEEEEEEDEEKIEEQVLALMGLSVPKDKHQSSGSPPPVPRRSPRRRIDSAEQQMQQQQQQQQQDNRRAKHISTIHSRKDASTTDVYFAPQQTLPSLLQMIAHSAQEEEESTRRKKQASVEEQLDEMMRSFQLPVEPTKF